MPSSTGYDHQAVSRETDSLRTQLSALTEERDRYREALEECKRLNNMDRPISCVDVVDAALSLSPLPEREAEREVLKAAEEWFSDWKDYGALSQTYQNLREAVRKLRSLREKG